MQCGTHNSNLDNEKNEEQTHRTPNAMCKYIFESDKIKEHIKICKTRVSWMVPTK